MISLGAGRVRAMVHTRGEPSDIELAAAHAFFYHPSPGRQRDQPRVRLGAGLRAVLRGTLPPPLVPKLGHASPAV